MLSINVCSVGVQVPLSVPSGPPTPVHYNGMPETVPQTEGCSVTSATQPVVQDAGNASAGALLGNTSVPDMLSSASPQPVITSQQAGTVQASETFPGLNEPSLTASPLPYGAVPLVSAGPEPTLTASPLSYGAVPVVMPTNQTSLANMASPIQSGLMFPAPVKIELPSVVSSNAAITAQQPSSVIPGGSPPSIKIPSVPASPQVPLSVGVAPPGSAALERT